ncbi:amidase [Agromyces sp. SYSU T00194]|uniref:amidase n=1 Tax=Agromyces chitinivorans TaxID=3158560 RepID=UPI003398C1AE
MTALHELSAVAQRDLLQRGTVSPTELVAHYLERIARLGPASGAFTTVRVDAALARAADVEASASPAAPLWGMPLADKDLVRRAGVPTGFGSRAFAGFVPDASDPLADDLDAAGAVSVGKTATPEFGLTSSAQSLASAPVRHPLDASLDPGGSSGGAAVAVAAGLLPFAPGSDGGGSIRIPAAACGLVGIKPSRGRVPEGSGIAMLGGLPVAGAIGRDVADAALLLDGMVAPRGLPARHPFALRAPGEDGPFLSAAMRASGRFQLAVLRDTPWDEGFDVSVSPEADEALTVALDALAVMGQGLEELPRSPEPAYPDAFRTLWQVGAASIPLEPSQEPAVEPLTAWLREVGRRCTGTELAAALAELTAFERRTIARFAPYDAIVSPALAMTPRPIGWYDQQDGEANFAQQVRYTPFTSFVNVAGLPAVTVPVRRTAEGLPMGVQLIGRPGGEATILTIAAMLQRRLRPPAPTFVD